eukprot:TRINITY_DN2467_c0_g12_i1.p1 TRINITY_DN2467_c0_g12~~TRINITY_DN2467_c0_g12_i1.p1  ORF type:complete len:534 (-),score=108.91 TRINITY_DN2467_c0_g12_i1:70-1614(-)
MGMKTYPQQPSQANLGIQSPVPQSAMASLPRPQSIGSTAPKQSSHGPPIPKFLSKATSPTYAESGQRQFHYPQTLPSQPQTHIMQTQKGFGGSDMALQRNASAMFREDIRTGSFSAKNGTHFTVTPHAGGFVNSAKETPHMNRVEAPRPPVISVTDQSPTLNAQRPRLAPNDIAQSENITPKAGETANRYQGEKFFGTRMEEIDKELVRLTSLISKKETELQTKGRPGREDPLPSPGSLQVNPPPMMAPTIEDHQKKLKDQETCIVDLSKKLKRAEEAYGTLQQKYFELEKQTSARDSKNQSRINYEVVIGDLTGKIDAMSRELQESTRIISGLREAETRFSNALETSNKEKERLMVANKELTARVEMMRMQINELEKRIINGRSGPLSPSKDHVNSSTNSINSQKNRSILSGGNQEKINAALLDENIRLKMRVAEQKKEIEGLMRHPGNHTPSRNDFTQGGQDGAAGAKQFDVIRYYDGLVARLEERVNHLTAENTKLNHFIRSSSAMKTNVS